MKLTQGILVGFMVHLILLVCTEFINPLTAQQPETSILNGRLIDVETNEPIEHAMCALKHNEFIGSVTDKEGSFNIKIRDIFLYDTLVFYLLGYERLDVPLADIDLNENPCKFYLERKSYLLAGIEVRAHNYDLKKIVMKAIKKVPRNFPNRKHQLQGFYRSLSTKDNQYTHLTEAAFILDDYSYTRMPSEIRLNVHQFRQSDETADVDSVHVRFRNQRKLKLAEKGHDYYSNGIAAFYKGVGIRMEKFFDPSYELQSIKVHEKDEFELVDVSAVAGDTIYEIAFDNMPFVKNNSSRTVFGKVTLKINKSDQAIIESVYQADWTTGELFHKHHVKYQKIDGKYYPEYLMRMSQRYGLNRESKDGEYTLTTMWVEDVKSKKYDRIKKDESISRKFSWDTYWRMPYDAAFWKSYTMLHKHPLEKAAKIGLERHDSLENQFHRNSERKYEPR